MEWTSTLAAAAVTNMTMTTVAISDQYITNEMTATMTIRGQSDMQQYLAILVVLPFFIAAITVLICFIVGRRRIKAEKER